MVEDGHKSSSEWTIPNGSNFTRSFDRATQSHIVTFATSGQYDSSITLHLDHVLDLVLSLDVLLKTNSSLIVTLQNRETKKTYTIHYIMTDLLLSVQDDNFYYGLGYSSTTGSWKHITRDLLIDLQKGLQATTTTVGPNANGNSHASPPGVMPEKNKKKHRRTEIKVLAVSFLGSGSFDNVTFSTSEHIAQFYDAAEWFVRHQDPKTGGWPNPVKRKLSEFAELKSGWYSAMGQGHALSLLARAYHHSKGDARYLRAAINGLKPFRVPSTQGGVLAKFMGKFEW